MLMLITLIACGTAPTPDADPILEVAVGAFPTWDVLVEEAAQLCREQCDSTTYNAVYNFEERSCICTPRK